MEWSDADFADLLIQPVEHSYTVESLEELCESSGLAMLYPCITLYVKSLASTLSYNLEFNDAALQQRYDDLPDTRRWQITNLMLHEKSPLLWFYLQRRPDGGLRRKDEKEICDEFLNSRFKRTGTMQRSYLRREDAGYSLMPGRVSYPKPPGDSFSQRIYEAVEESLSMREIFERLDISPTFQNVNKARITLTTSAYPFLMSVQ
jgi:hypothetical protein